MSSADHYTPEERTQLWNYYRNRSNPQSYPSRYPFDRSSQGGFDRYPDSGGASGSGIDENRQGSYPTGHGEGYYDTYSGNSS